MIKRLFYLLLLIFLLGHSSSAWGADRGEILSGETRIGLNIVSPSYMDTWTFNGQKNDRVIITAVPTSGILDTFISLYPPDGGPAEATTIFDQLDHQLNKTGLYTIVIVDFGLNNEGTYNITLLKIPGAVSSPEDPDGGPIASGQTLSPGGTIIPSDLDAFQFYGQKNDRVIITAVPTSGILDTFISLYPPDGGPAEATTIFDQLDHQLNKTGLYTIVIVDFGLNNEGTYNISLTKIPSNLRPGIYNPTPPDGDIVCDLSGSFGWDPVSGATGYDLYFGENVIEPLVKIGDNLSSPTDPFPALTPGNIYYWHVVAHTPGGDIEGPYWWFEVSSTPIISVNPPSLDFGNVIIDNTSPAQTVTVSNNCTADLIIGTLTIEGANSSEFSIQNNNCSGRTIPQSGQCTVDVVFSPDTVGTKNAALSIPSNDIYQPTFAVPLTGTGALPDLTPPTPNPMTWATSPYQTGTTSISMVATTASDPTTPITYNFDFVNSPTGGTGGIDSGWQPGTSYTNSGLQANHRYGYRVKAKDGSSNETGYSTTQYCYTAIEAPTGISFGAVTPTSIQFQSTNTPSGLARGSSGLFIENITNQTNSGWKQNNDLWTSSPLSPNTSYNFRAKARNGDAAETAYSSTASRYTLANLPGTDFFTNITMNCIRANWTVKSNPNGTEYLCENTTGGTNSGWIAGTFWDSCNLACNTTYSFRVKARNRDGIETGWISLGDQWTQSCDTGPSIVLQFPAFGAAFHSCSLIPNYQPTFSWTTTETFAQFTILFSTSRTDFSTRGILLTKATVPGTRRNSIPSITVWKAIMKSSHNNNSPRSIYWKIVGTKPDKTAIHSDVGAFHIGAPQEVTINTPVNCPIIESGTIPTFNFSSSCNLKFVLEISSSSDFGDPNLIKRFTFTTRNPNVDTVLNRTLTSQQWIAVRQLIGSGTGYFRIKAWDAINRESVSGVACFIIESSLIGTWDIQGRETITATYEGGRTRRTSVSFRDEFIFYPDGAFDMIGQSGTWAQQGSAFTVALPYEEIEQLFEQSFANQGYNVDVVVTSISFTGKENIRNDTISGKIVIAMDLYHIYNNLPRRINVDGPFTGKRQKEPQLSVLKGGPPEGKTSLIETIGTELNQMIQK